MKKILSLLLSWIASLAVFLFVASLFFHGWATLVFPYAVSFSYLLKHPEELVPLQYSYSGRVPDDYIAILGDSYAFGQGDGLNRLQTGYRPAYNVTHFIHRETGRDIVSFGVPSSGSIKAYLTDLASQLAAMERSYFNRIGKPAYFVLYFYEGNDIEENVSEAKKLLAAHGDDEMKLQEFATSQAFFDAVMARQLDATRIKDDGWLPTDMQRMCDFFRHALLFVTGRDELAAAFRSLPDEASPVGSVNRIVQNQREVAIPDGLQGPSLLLGEAETELGFAIMARAVHALRSMYPDTPMVMVAVPSPATVYRFVSADIDLWDLMGNAESRLRPSTLIRQRSNVFCERARVIAGEHRILFHDARPALAAQGDSAMLHGPVDMHHFNLAGYQVLSGEVLTAVQALTAGQSAGLRNCVALQ